MTPKIVRTTEDDWTFRASKMASGLRHIVMCRQRDGDVSEYLETTMSGDAVDALIECLKIVNYRD